MASGLLPRIAVPSFLILTSADLPEAYFLGAVLESMAQPFALVNIVARPAGNRLQVLRRLWRRRGALFVADLLLGRLVDRLTAALNRRGLRETLGAFPEIDAQAVRAMRTRHPHLDCHDPHAPEVLDFVRRAAPDYILLAGTPVLKPSFYGLARHAALNRHLGLVPDFRGSDCAIWAFALGRPESAGYTVHVVTERVDGGDVLLRQPVPVKDDPTLGDYLRRHRRESSEGFAHVIRQIVDGVPLRPVSQASTGRHFPPSGFTARRRAARNYMRLVRQRGGPGVSAGEIARPQASA